MTRAPCKRWPAPCAGQLTSPAAARPRSFTASCRQPLPSPPTSTQDPSLGEGQEVCPAGGRLGPGRQGASLRGRGPAARERSRGLTLQDPTGDPARETTVTAEAPPPCRGELAPQLPPRQPQRPASPAPPRPARGTGPAASGDKCPLATKTRSAPFPGAPASTTTPLGIFCWCTADTIPTSASHVAPSASRPEGVTAAGHGAVCSVTRNSPAHATRGAGALTSS